MLESFIESVVDWARRRAGAVCVGLLVLVAAAGFYVATHFAINTDITSLLDSTTPWRQREIAFAKAFPQRQDLIALVIDGKDAVRTDAVAAKLKAALQANKTLFRSVTRPEDNPYFSRNGLLLLPTDSVATTTEQLIKSQPLLAGLAADPSLRGLFKLMGLMVDGLNGGQVEAETIAPLLERVNPMLHQAVAGGGQAQTAWAYLTANPTPGKFELRRFVLAQPVLDYSALAPAHAATDFINKTIAELKRTDREDDATVQIRITGDVVLADEEFSSIADGMGLAAGVSLAVMLLLLFLALRSWRLILPIFVVLLAGLTLTTAFALLAVGALNLISVAFAVLFTGIAIDFSIQFTVRTREVRVTMPDLDRALRRTGFLVAVPLLLAALSTAAGFLSFTPTLYRGVAELGLIAGFGMILAFILNITLLPALLHFTKPKPEAEAIGYKWAAPIDTLLEVNRLPVLLFFAALFVLAATSAGLSLRFDFDPLNLKDPHSQAVATLFDLAADPDTTPYSADVLASNTETAEALADKLRALPEVDHVLTLLSLVPDNQDEKLALIADAASLLNLAINPAQVAPAPDAAELKEAAAALIAKIQRVQPPTPLLVSLKANLESFAEQDAPTLILLDKGFQAAATSLLAQIKTRLAQPKLDFTDIPGDLKSDWVAVDGTTRLEVYPKGNPRDAKTLVNFVAAVQRVAPQATGMPVSIQESANTIKQAFIQAGCYALLAIFLLLWAVLRRLQDTLFVLLPLVLAAALTLGTASILHLALNFANIIALPLLLGLGVSYSIYFVVYWRQGNVHPLQSATARAVLFSAATTLVAFGSLSLSKHPGTASMGVLLTLSLFYVLLTTLFFLPALLAGRARPR